MSAKLNNSASMFDYVSLYKQPFQRWICFSPQWWTWALSGLVWVWLVSSAGMGGDHEGSMHHMHHGDMFQLTSASNTVLTLSAGLGGWVVMVIAMMFPLLNEQIRHVAFSIPQRRKNFAITLFLSGYTLLWSLAGLAFLSMKLVMDCLLYTSPSPRD